MLLNLDHAEFGSLLATCAAGGVTDAAVLRLLPSQVAQSLVALRTALPCGTDVPCLVTAHPALLLADHRVAGSITALRVQAARSGVDIDALALEAPSAFGELLGEFMDCDGRLDQVHPFLRAWMSGNLGVR